MQSNADNAVYAFADSSRAVAGNGTGASSFMLNLVLVLPLIVLALVISAVQRSG